MNRKIYADLYILTSTLHDNLMHNEDIIHLTHKFNNKKNVDLISIQPLSKMSIDINFTLKLDF